jgi:hypothetical protein
MICKETGFTLQYVIMVLEMKVVSQCTEMWPNDCTPIATYNISSIYKALT